LLLLTGARVSELLHAQWQHVDLERQTWLIPLSKNGKHRYVPLPQAAIDIMNNLPKFDRCPYLIPNPETRLPFVSFKRAWNTARTEAGLKALRIHDLRHSAATAMAAAGVDLLAIGKVLGHSDYKSTLRYAHAAQSTLLKAVEAGSATWATQ
jgi:integrase